MVSKEQHHQPSRRLLSSSQTISLLYHDIFNWPLKKAELERWTAGRSLRLGVGRSQFEIVNDCYVLKGRSRLVASRESKERHSREKMKLLAKAKPILENSTDIVFVGITGSLAMNAASSSSDIDLLIVTKPGKLWTTRVRTLLNLKRFNLATRKAGDKNQKDRLCLNIWMDERDLVIKDKNAYTAHELSQIVPYINKNEVYEKLVSSNLWIKDYWPNATLVSQTKSIISSNPGLLDIALEKLTYFAQRVYMFGKVTEETINPTRAFFHPRNLSVLVKKELSLRGVT